jgi:putative PIN family toxin of toxin-antitoxin system
MQVVLDTNVIISAFLTAEGNPSRILQMILEKKLDFVYNMQILAEYEGVMSRDKFSKKINQEQVKSFINLIKNLGKNFLPQASEIPKLTDETDRIFYDTAKNTASILITGNIKHYPNENFILTPAKFLTLRGYPGLS